MFKTFWSTLILTIVSFIADAQTADVKPLIGSLSGEWATYKWVIFENTYKTFSEDEQNDITFDSLGCIASRPVISFDSIVFDREKACGFKPCYNPFANSGIQKLLVISTTDQNQRRPGIELRLGKISKYLLRLMGEDIYNSSPYLITTGCESAEDKDEKLSLIYFSDKKIALYSSKDVIVLKKIIIPVNPGDE